MDTDGACQSVFTARTLRKWPSSIGSITVMILFSPAHDPALMKLDTASVVLVR